MTNEITLWTIGHSNRSIESFLDLLNEHGIKVLADIRSFPTSKIEHFKQENIQKWLAESGVEYVWLGKELGGYRKGGYKRHMRTKLFEDGVKRLLEIAQQKRACMMCMEINPKYCHRRFLSDFLERKGATVVHILGKGQTSLLSFKSVSRDNEKKT
jgi:uncharacterized protein (DUF488 family)